MASPLKRKHGHKGVARPVHSPQKRLRPSAPSPPSSGETESDSQKNWEVRRICEQSGERYRLEWAGVDEKGEAWPASWVHGDNLRCPDLLEDWEASRFQRDQDEEALRILHSDPILNESTQSTLSVRGRKRSLIQSSSTFEIQETREDQDHITGITQIDGAGERLGKAATTNAALTQTQAFGSSRSLNREDSTLGSSLDGSPGLVPLPEVQVEQSSSLDFLSQGVVPDVGSIERITSSRSIRSPPSQTVPGHSQSLPKSNSAGPNNGSSLLFFNSDDDRELAREQRALGLGISLVEESEILQLSYPAQPFQNSNGSQEIPTSYQPVTQIQSSPLEPPSSSYPSLSQQLNGLISNPAPLIPLFQPLSSPFSFSTQTPRLTPKSLAAARLFSCSQSDIMASNAKLRNQLHALRAGSRTQASPLSKNASPAPSAPRSPLTRSQRLNSPEESSKDVAVEDQPVPSREPESPIRPGKTMDVDESREDIGSEVDSPELDILPLPILHAREIVVPLPIDGRLKHQYMDEISCRSTELNAYIQDSTNPRLVESMQTIICTLCDTLIHTDMDLGHAPVEFDSTQHFAGYSEVSSMKFALLDHLIRMLADRKASIAIFGRSAPAQGKRQVTDLIYAYLRGKGVECALISPDTEVAQTEETKYHVLSTQDLTLLPKSTQLIIAFDDSLEVPDLPQWSSDIPVLLPWIVFSPEHIARCIPADVPTTERLRRQVEAIVDHRFSLGEWQTPQLFAIDPNARPTFMKRDFLYRVENAAAIIVNALATNSIAPALFPIPELETMYHRVPPNLVAEPVSRAGTPGQKRLRDDATVSQSKRQRLTPQGDVSHVTDSMKGTQSPGLLKASQTALANERIAHKQTQAALDQLVLDHRSLQNRYEQRRRDAHAQSKVHREQTTALETLEGRHKALQASHNTLREALRTTTANFASARADLMSSPNLDVAALATAREEARTAQDEIEKAQGRLKSRDSDFEFLREQYQTASTAAAELGNKVSELEAELTELKADINPVTTDEKIPALLSSRNDFPALANSAAQKADLARVEELEIELATMRAAWERAEEEVVVLRRMRGGVVTRGGSAQPQFAGVGSRGASPMTGVGAGGNGASAGSGAGTGTGGAGAGWRPNILRDER